MKVSPKKRAANRRNALKSTGPKTGTGRRASSLNATRHGLSVPLPTPLVDPLHKELAQLIMRDGIEPDAAVDLAQKIIEYERNLVNLQDIYQKEMRGPEKVMVGGSVISVAPIDRPGEIERILAAVKDVDLKGLDKAEREEMKLLAQMSKIIARANKSNLINTRRYFKRSSNQLIKALKRL